MITTKAEVLNYIKDATEDLDFNRVETLTATAVSDVLSISRSLASQYLNELYREKLFIKVSSRPVLFLHKEVIKYTYGISLKNQEYLNMNQLKKELDNAIKLGGFDDLIGYNGTLKTVVDQMKASVSYPPFGLPLLMVGKDGVGKFTLVETVFQHARKHNELYRNKQMKHLDMKHFKDEDFETLIMEVVSEEIGMLYLSHIDEMNAMNLDLLIQGLLRENDLFKHSCMIIVSAEDDKNLPSEFIEKIPLITKLPSFEERYLEERVALVLSFLHKESSKLKKTIYISRNVLNLIAQQNYDGQIIQLHRIIINICASAYAESHGKECIEIKMYHLLECMDLKAIPKQSSDDGDRILINDILNDDLELFEHYEKIVFNMNHAKHMIQNYCDYISHHEAYDLEHINDIRTSLKNLFTFHPVLKQDVFFINNVSLISRIVYTIKRNEKAIKVWEDDHKHIIQNVILNLHYQNQKVYDRITLLTHSMYNYSGISLNKVNQIVLLC